MTDLATLAAPPDVTGELTRLRESLAAAAGDNLVALAIYGGLAHGRYRPGASDVNLVVVLRDASRAALAAIAPALHGAWRAIRVEPFIVTPEDLPRAAEAFPTKLLDIQLNHLVIFGSDPFQSLTVSRESVRRRAAQELRNVGLRLRRRYIAVSHDSEGVSAALEAIVVPLAVDLAAMLQLAGKEALADETPATIFAQAADTFGLDRDALAALAALREGSEPADLAALFDRALATVFRAADAADRLIEP